MAGAFFVLAAGAALTVLGAAFATGFFLVTGFLATGFLTGALVVFGLVATGFFFALTGFFGAGVLLVICSSFSNASSASVVCSTKR